MLFQNVTHVQQCDDGGYDVSFIGLIWTFISPLRQRYIQWQQQKDKKERNKNQIQSRVLPPTSD